MSKPSILYISSSEKGSYPGTDTMVFTRLKPDSLSGYQAIVVDDFDKTRDIIRAIREHKDPRVYLIPLFLRTGHLKEPLPYFHEVVDGFFRNDNWEQFLASNSTFFETMNRKSDEITQNNFHEDQKDNHILFKIVRYIYTRNIPLKPVMTSSSPFAFLYPVVDIFLSENSSQQFTLVDFLENRELIRGTFLDIIHSCPHCLSGFLNFREICPHCASADLKSEDMIHHFVCAYIGPEGDFKKQQNLVCPKCLKPLKHIGVDFDRPSTVYQCRHCQKNSQETDVDAICIHCGKRSLPENLIKKTLKEYQLTSFGEHSAKFGIVISLKEALKVDLEIVELNVFKMFLQLECERIKRYKISRSTVGVFIINNFIDLFAEFGKRSREISGEMSRVISQTLRTTDIISHLSDSTLIFLLTETSLENARQAMNRLKNRIVELIKVNFKKDVQIKTECIPVQKNSSSDELMKKAEKYV